MCVCGGVLVISMSLSPCSNRQRTLAEPKYKLKIGRTQFAGDYQKIETFLKTLKVYIN